MKINPEFRVLIPPLAPDELAQLEANLAADGCRDPLVVWQDTLLDGHNRLEICSRKRIKFTVKEIKLADENAAKVWVIQNQFGRRNLAPYSRVELALKLEPLLAQEAEKRMKAGKADPVAKLPQGKTRDRLARIAGVSGRTFTSAKFIAENGTAAQKKRLRENEDTINAVVKEIKESAKQQERKAKRQTAEKSITIDERIIVGDFRKQADKVADGSVALIFTDPPYDREASKMLPGLTEFAANKLAEGGSLICYVGQTQIPAALDAFRVHLRYWWTIACIHSGNATVMREYGIKAQWKAVLWFVKKTRDDKQTMVSDVMSGGKEKDFHEWQQSESEATYWIDKLCPKNGLVCDPFLGSGTTAVAAESLKRKWIGFEIDEHTAAVANKRLNDDNAIPKDGSLSKL